MGTARTPGRLRPHARTFRECVREFLTPAVWKRAHRAHPARRRGTRWALPPLVLVALFATWCCGDSVDERFETARAFVVAGRPKRRRPGQTVRGFRRALARLPVAALRAVAAGVRDRLAAAFGETWAVDGFIPLGCDGTRVECPRARALERRLGQAGKDGSAPTVWVTALVHLRLGLLWAWRVGRGTASERGHLVRMIPLLPRGTLLVADAGYVGFEVAKAVHHAGHAFLIRMSSKVTLYTDRARRLETFREGPVYYWPAKAAGKGEPPLELRLIRVRRRGSQHDVWLLTNVRDPARLSAAAAGRFYRWRWESEGLFRTYKRTLAKAKLHSRAVRLVHREAETSLLATQLLLAQGASAVRAAGGPGDAVTSPRKVLRRIRAEIAGARAGGSFRARLAGATRERRNRTSPKEARVWPRRGPHRPPKPPQVLKLTTAQKAKISRLKTESG